MLRDLDRHTYGRKSRGQSPAGLAVIGVPNEDFGEEVKAVVQPVSMPADAEAAAQLEQELSAYCRERLADSGQNAIGIFIRVKFDDLRRFTPDTSGEDFEGFDGCVRRKGFEVGSDFHNDSFGMSS